MYQIIVCSNQIRMVVQTIPWVRSVALGFFLGVGSRHEKKGEEGAAHFLEHLFFKGTERHSTMELAMEMDAIGGQVNAYTTKEYTCYYLRCLDQHMERGRDLLCEMLFSHHREERDVELERGVILEEIGMYQDTPEEVCAESLAQAIYPEDSLGHPILGSQSSLMEMTGSWLGQWKERHYTTQSLVVSVVGHVTKEQIASLKCCLEQLSPGGTHTVPPAHYEPGITLRPRETEQNHVILALPALSYLHPKRDQLTLLNHILGGGCSSRLFQGLRETRGLCYHVDSYVSDYQDTGFWAIYTACRREQEEEALQCIGNILRELADHGPTQEELIRAKEQIQANLWMGMESVERRMSHLGVSLLLYGRVRDTQELVDGYGAVTQEELRELAQSMCICSKGSLSVVGQVREEQVYAQWLATLGS